MEIRDLLFHVYIFSVIYAKVVIKKNISICLGKFQLYRYHLTLHKFKLA